MFLTGGLGFNFVPLDVTAQFVKLALLPAFNCLWREMKTEGDSKGSLVHIENESRRNTENGFS